MDDKAQAIIDAKAKVLKSLGHPTRLFIVEELARGERCVCELVKLVGADFSTVSKHLTLLKNAGVVQDDKRGQMVYYTLKVPCILRFMDCIEAVIGTGSCR
ncbi:MAG: metalloregulator ArsR/SmtB family transcription factor [Victivallaceae bacterium]|jgi:ArsR family transcriptional regulator